MKNIPKKIYLSEDSLKFTYPTVSFDRGTEFQSEYILATPAIKAAYDERRRQINEEGYDEKHDDKHDENQLALAAVTYAIPDDYVDRLFAFWPWDEKHWKPIPNDRKREITKAMALLIAEYERIERKETGNDR